MTCLESHSQWVIGLIVQFSNPPLGSLNALQCSFLYKGQGCLPSLGTHVGMSYTVAADQSRMMQEQMTGAAMAMPADTNKAFKVCFVIFQSCTEALNGSQRTSNALFPSFTFLQFQLPTVNCIQKYSVENSKNKQVTVFTVLSSVMKSCAVLFHPTQDTNHPFVHYIHINLTHLMADESSYPHLLLQHMLVIVLFFVTRYSG